MLLAVDVAAQQVGLKVGMAATQAQALVPGLTMMDSDTATDNQALARLAEWALRYSPISAPDAPDGLVIDTTGAEHLHGGEEKMLRDIRERLNRVGIDARVAIADTWGAAYALARFHREASLVVPEGMSAQEILPLHLASLRLPSAAIMGLREVGFETVRDLERQPRAPLAHRFGHEVLRRLDQAMGRVAEPVSPVRPADPIEVVRGFGEPIAAAETIAKYIGELVPDLCLLLEERGRGARRVDLICHRVDNRHQAVRVGLAVPMRDSKKLTRLLHEQIEKIDPGFGIEKLVISATLAEPMGAKQTLSSLAADPEIDMSGLVDVIANRIGEKKLYRFAPAESDVPERSVVRVSPMSPPSGKAWPMHWPRPSRLLPRPENIEVVALLPDHPPVAFTWRGVRRRVKRADGPERVFGEWWKREAELTTVRDYFQVEDEAGERFWVYRAGDGEHADTGSQGWYMHGIFG